jgi:squalene synthase HpnC
MGEEGRGAQVGGRELTDGGRDAPDGTTDTPDGKGAHASVTAGLERAYDECLAIARGHYENFPVASRLLPRALRRHVAAIYAFARIADDFADEPGRTDEERLHLLDHWGDLLRESIAHRAPFDSEPASLAPRSGLASHRAPRTPHAAPRTSHLAPSHLAPSHPAPRTAHPAPDRVFLALSSTIREFDLESSLFEDLLSAFRQDVTTTRYATWADVFDYCRRSANPVGRLVLRLSGYRNAELDRASDAVCTALQLTNFWQDLAIDWSRGRLYVPEETWRACGADPSDLDRGRMSPAWQAALQACADRTRESFEQGRSVADGVSGRLRWELRATWLGGMRILDRLEHGDFDVFSHRPTLGVADSLVIAWGALRWRT